MSASLSTLGRGKQSASAMEDNMEPLKDSPLDLFTSRTETGWELNMDGDMLTSNEPHPPDRRRAPVFFLSWSSEGFAIAFRDDVQSDLRQ